MAKKLGGGLALSLGLIVVLVLAATGVAPWAAAAPTSPPGPDPADPPGPDSAFSFDLYGPRPTDDVVLRWMRRPWPRFGPPGRPRR